MSDYCIAVVDAAKARLFTLEEARLPEVESGPKLVEKQGLVNPDKMVPGHAMFGDAKGGRNRQPAGGQAHRYDDHRDNHEQEFEKRFAKTVATEIEKCVRAERATRIVLAAEPHMLGTLRKHLDALTKSGIALHELALNVCKLAPAEIQDLLAKNKLLPACRKPPR